MNEEKIARINELAKKARADGLTSEEKAEQKAPISPKRVETCAKM